MNHSKQKRYKMALVQN